MRGNNLSGWISNFLFTILLLGFSIQLSAQSTSSPYSRYGFGDLNRNSFSQNFSMGRTAIGLRQSSFINFENPASYSNFDLTVFEAGINSNFTRFETQLIRETRNYANLGYIGMGFPVKPWWGLSFGLMPYSSVGYNVVNTLTVPDVGDVATTHIGEGGINRVYLGNGFKYKRFSFGINASFLFGTVSRERTSVFAAATGIPMNTLVSEEIFVNDFIFDGGIQYKQPINDSWNLIIGAIYGMESKINGTREYLAANYRPAGAAQFILDTTIFESSAGSMIIPQTFGAGISIEGGNRWLFAADYKRGEWNRFTSFGRPGTLIPASDYRLGAQYVPDRTAALGFWKLLQYRAGFRYSQTYLEVNNTQIQEIGITIGTGIPLRRTRSTVNIGIEVGQRGRTSNNLIREQFVNLNFGMAINDRWFIKRRYD
jgi:hypothetical protein